MKRNLAINWRLLLTDLLIVAAVLAAAMTYFHLPAEWKASLVGLWERLK